MNARTQSFRRDHWIVTRWSLLFTLSCQCFQCCSRSVYLPWAQKDKNWSFFSVWSSQQHVIEKAQILYVYRANAKHTDGEFQRDDEGRVADLKWYQLSPCQSRHVCLSRVLTLSKWDKWRRACSSEQTKRYEMSQCALLFWNTHCSCLVIREEMSNWKSGN